MVLSIYTVRARRVIDTQPTAEIVTRAGKPATE